MHTEIEDIHRFNQLGVKQHTHLLKQMGFWTEGRKAHNKGNRDENGPGNIIQKLG
ncbi:MAG: hypothetical protein GWN81_17520 [Phycisphaerae bacterium]|nr:hypothetical protein [Phycisphaerae bacterium]NIU10608.1 hypothetical protein [Phycisphaerae bacterium]NIW47917.1 hypothetical protein [Gammaproteobacteria bacterium]NIX00592.1 hypothetical protein [Phycisphaerae bacterium]NIX30228.1 hypothetical protein [Phycisphaerae bacterium]